MPVALCSCLALVLAVLKSVAHTQSSQQLLTAVHVLHLLLIGAGFCQPCGTGMETSSTCFAGSVYVDPGATATDNVDGNITSELSTFGLGAIDTSAPNNASDPFLITYDVSDTAGNAAVQGLRQVLVVCRSPKVLCTASDGTLYCSTSTGLCVQLTATTAAVSTAVPPTIKLVGQAVLGVTLGSSYLACPTPQPTNVLCDRSGSDLTRRLRCWAGALFQPYDHFCLSQIKL